MIPSTIAVLSLVLTSLLLAQPEAQKDAVRIELTPLDYKLGDGPVANVFFSGENYGGVEIQPRQVSLSPDPNLRFVSEYIRANLIGKDEDLVSFWHPDERAAITRLASDPKVIEKNRRHMESVSRWFVLARIQYGGYTLFLTCQIFRDKQALPNVFPAKFEKNRYWLTNRLLSDPMFQYLSRSVAIRLQNDLLAKRPELLK